MTEDQKSNDDVSRPQRILLGDYILGVEIARSAAPVFLLRYR